MKKIILLKFSVVAVLSLVVFSCKKPSTACFTMSATTVNVGQSVSFTSCSKCTKCSSHNTVSDLQWDFGDGTMGSGTPVDHIYNSAGQFTITLTSNDSDKDAKGTISQVITVVAPSSPQTSNDVTINITNMADNAVLKISKDTVYTYITPKYINAFGDTFTVTKFRYYISNIKLKKSDNSYYYENNSYHLVDASDSTNTCKFNLSGVPYGTYTQIEYLIGVDSTRNCSGAQTGQLDPIKDMFWNWSQGYIFLKFEAYTSAVSSFGSHNVEYHVGGFSGANNNIKKVILPLTTNLVVDNDHVSKIYLKANAKECLKTPTTISFATLQTAISPSSAKPIANNFADMFSVSSVVH